jgi:hypothetical protein
MPQALHGLSRGNPIGGSTVKTERATIGRPPEAIIFFALI